MYESALTEKVNSMSNLNESFNKYKDMSSNPVSSVRDREQVLNDYLDDRKSVHREVLKREATAWKGAINNNDSKTLWSKIDWKGNHTANQLCIPLPMDLRTFLRSCIHVMTLRR